MNMDRNIWTPATMFHMVGSAALLCAAVYVTKLFYAWVMNAKLAKVNYSDTATRIIIVVINLSVKSSYCNVVT